MKCLVCRKDIETFYDGECLRNAGKIEMSFGYGSDFDQANRAPTHIAFQKNKEERRAFNLIDVDIIQAYICDCCFEKNCDIIEGYNVSKKIEYKRSV